MKYRKHIISKKNNIYYCKELELTAKSLKAMINKINKKKGYSKFNNLEYLEGFGYHVFQVSLDPIEGEYIMQKFKEIKKNQKLRNRKEVLKFLISLYEV